MNAIEVAVETPTMCPPVYNDACASPMEALDGVIARLQISPAGLQPNADDSFGCLRSVIFAPRFSLVIIGLQADDMRTARNSAAGPAVQARLPRGSSTDNIYATGTTHTSPGDIGKRDTVMIDERSSTSTAWREKSARPVPDREVDATHLVRIDKSLRPLVPRMKRLVEGYADFLHGTLRDHSSEVIFSTARDLRALAELFGMAAIVDLCVRLEWAVRSKRDDEASQCIDELAGIVHNATFVYI